MSSQQAVANKVTPLAQVGLIAKSIVYCLLGILVFMAAFHLNGQSPSETNKQGVFSFVQRQVGGKILLGLIAAGLMCYCAWRYIQAVLDTEKKGNSAKGLLTRGRYFLSGLLYSALTFYLTKQLFTGRGDNGNSKQSMVEWILEKPLGQWIIGFVAIGFVGVGLYQVYYGLSEKYKQHVDKTVEVKQQRLLLLSGKIGYVARGLVWMVLGWIFFKVAYQSNASSVGGSSEAFQFLSEVSYGSYVLAAVGIGLICFGVFNSVRARYETFVE